MENVDKLIKDLNTPTMTAAGTLAQLSKIRAAIDLNADGKISANEFMLGLSHYPKIIALIFSLLSSVYLIVKVVVGFFQGFDTISIIVSICIIIAMVVVYFTMKQSNNSQISTIKNIEEKTKKVVDAANETIRTMEVRMIELDEENMLLKTQNGMYKFVVETFQKMFPDAKIPNPALPDMERTIIHKPVVNESGSTVSTPPT